MRVHLAYGKIGMDIDLPANVQVDIIEPRFTPAVPDEAQAVRAALRSPVASPPLTALYRPGDQIAIVFSDITRPMPNERVLPVLLAELESAGARPQDITLINALATHRPQTPAELAGMLGAALVERYTILQHDAWNAQQLTPICSNHLGKPVSVNRAYASAQLRILTGFIEPHFFAGFSGGPKAVLPGIADAEAIMDNHNAAMIASPWATWGVTRGNPIWEEMHSVALASHPDFLLNVALNRDKRITAVFAGDLTAAHDAGTRYVLEHAMQPVDEAYDVVIATNAGYPLDLNLYQSVKGLSAAAQIVKEGGALLLAAECWDGIPEHGGFAALLRSEASPDALLKRIAAPGFHQADQWQVQILAQILKKASVHVFSGGLSRAQVESLHLHYSERLETTLGRILEQKPGARVAVLPQGPQTIPYLRMQSEAPPAANQR